MSRKAAILGCALSCLVTVPPSESFAITIDAALRTIVAERLNIDEGEVVATAALTDDLGADSLDLVELMMSVEEEYDIAISEQVCLNIQTIGDLQSMVNSSTASAVGMCPQS